MSALPQALRPWAQSLSLFPPEVALTLGPHVARLAQAVGPLPPRGETEGGEPAGWDGLTRRGHPERLLLTEWLYALEAPDEFLRRAAMGEQAFLEPGFRQPQGARRLVVLLDTGPSQLGAPRLAHLALLVVLATRAEEAGAAFAWGVLQRPAEGLVEGFREATVRRLLAARTAEEVAPAHWEAWGAHLGEVRGHQAEDVWLVGGARLARLAGAAACARALVEDVLEVEGAQVRVEVHLPRRSPRQALLALPAPAVQVHLLRDPFEQKKAVAPERKPGLPDGRVLAFCNRGQALLFSLADGRVGVQPIPRRLKAGFPRERLHTPQAGETLVALGWRRPGGLLSLVRFGQGLWLRGARQKQGGTGVLQVQPPQHAEPFTPHKEGTFALLEMGGGEASTEMGFVIDAKETLFSLRVEKRSAQMEHHVHPVAGMVTDGTGLRYLRRAALGRNAPAVLHHVALFGPHTEPERLQVGDEAMDREESPTLLTGHAPMATAAARAVFAMRLAQTRWWVHGPEGSHEVQVPLELDVLGVVGPLGEEKRTSLLVRSADGCELLLLAEEARTALLNAGEPILAAATAATTPLLAYVTQSGLLSIFLLGEGHTLLRRLPEAA